ncbi:tetratricopeptide repeat protein [Actinacidiphila guanduensis]|uniref:Transcriptional regulator n=1 Tax=Actinacidiphila guanduensis TaxID=310781 RepID=A0A1G9VPK4_9ACTN|nr:hypothetical protein [Actinacidiphila guanduensis]SDM74109.1 hypothetical protein SAMN05216259_101354 [Actinacidiphila guanduensis]
MPEARHPLTELITRRGWTNESYLRRVRDEYVRRGYGQFATRKEKVSRWTQPERPQVPTVTTQMAMAAVFGIPAREVQARGWPGWLLCGLQHGDAVWELPWTTAGTMEALEVGGPVDRRGFMTASTGVVAAVVAQWATALPAAAQASGRRIDAAAADRIDARLTALRHLDDDLGSDVVYDSAVAEMRLARRLLTEFSYTEEVGRRLFASAAEAARLAGWCAYDSGRTDTAEFHYAQALRAAGSAGDATVGAVAAAFWSIVRYNGKPRPDPAGALAMLNTALGQRAGIDSPRVVTLLHIRRARAYSIAGNPTEAYRAVDAALASYERGGRPQDDNGVMYWMTAGEIFQAAGSAALTLGEPTRALDFFTTATTHPDPYNATAEPRGAAIYEARRAEAYLAAGNIEGAVETARQAVALMGGVQSARTTGTLADLHTALTRHRRLPPVADFLDETS